MGYAKSPSAPLRRVGLATKSRTLAHSFFPRVPTTANAGIEDLREKREEINQQITDEEDEKSKVQSDLTVLSKRLTTLNDSIARKVRTREIKLPFTSARSIGRTLEKRARRGTTLTLPSSPPFIKGRREERLR